MNKVVVVMLLIYDLLTLTSLDTSALSLSFYNFWFSTFKRVRKKKTGNWQTDKLQQ